MLLAVGINARWVLRLLKKTPAPLTPFSFSVTLIMPLGGEKVPTVSLEAEIDGGGISLADLAEAALNGRDLSSLGLSEVGLYAASRGGRPALRVTNGGSCEISDADNVILSGKNIWWKDGERLTFADETGMARLEITFMV